MNVKMSQSVSTSHIITILKNVLDFSIVKYLVKIHALTVIQANGLVKVFDTKLRKSHTIKQQVPITKNILKWR